MFSAARDRVRTMFCSPRLARPSWSSTYPRSRAKVRFEKSLLPCGAHPDPSLGPHFAVAKAGDTRNAGVESAAPAPLGVDSDPFANLATELDFTERQSIAIQEFRHLVGRSQGFLLGAALIDGLRPQRLNALNHPREIFIASFGAGACRCEKQAAEIVGPMGH